MLLLYRTTWLPGTPPWELLADLVDVQVPLVRTETLPNDQVPRIRMEISDIARLCAS
jgi:hypothetical protein